MARRALALFAKLPAGATVKTRLVPPLTNVEAAALAAAFLEDSSAGLVRVAASLEAKPCLFYDPPSALNAIRRFIPQAVVAYPQADGDLARRLKSAYEVLANEGIAEVCFVGADSPTLPHVYIANAFSALRACEIVIGPASDGGYYLIGLRSSRPQVFEEIDWGTDRVFAQTQKRAVELGLPIEILAEWYDVDDARGLERLRSELLSPSASVAHGEDAPRTKAVLASLFTSDRMR